MVRNPVYDDPASTLAVVSSEGRVARVDEDRLRYASPAFVGLLDAKEAVAKTVEALPILTLDGKAEDIGLLLKYLLDPSPSDELPGIAELFQCVLVECDSRGLTLRTGRPTIVGSLTNLAFKYDAKQAATIALNEMHRYLPAEGPTVFAIAAAHG